MFSKHFSHTVDTARAQQVLMTKQTSMLLDHLEQGHTINFVEASEMGISHLTTRIDEIRQSGIDVYQKPIRIRNTACFEYKLQPYQLEHPHEAAAHQMKQQPPGEPPTGKKGKPRMAA